jgi:glutamate 5-kinase
MKRRRIIARIGAETILRSSGNKQRNTEKKINQIIDRLASQGYRILG